MTTSKHTENRRSQRLTPNSQVSVILYRENARPRGCYVSDYSDHGMLLKCMTREKTTRGNALKVGDDASIHFWDRGAPGRSDKVSGQIVRVNENLVAMEYSPAGTSSLGKLLTLLRHQGRETSQEKVSMKERPVPKLQLPDKNTVETQETAPLNGGLPEEKVERNREISSNGSSLQLGLLVLAVLAVIGLALYSFSLSSRLDEVTQIVDVLQTEQPNQVESTLPSDLTDRIAAVEQKQADMTLLLGDAVKQDVFRAAVEKFDSRLQGLQKKSQVAAKIENTPAASIESVATGQPSWIVNLATLSDNNAVGKFIEKANDLGLDVRAEQVAVNDKQMYRLSIPGITSYEEAERLAATVQQQLGLSQKPWIAKQ